MLEHTPVAYQLQGFRLRKFFESGETKRQPIDYEVPPNDRADQDEPFGDRLVFTGHRVLRGICNDDEKQNVGNTHGSNITAKHKSENEEQEKVIFEATHKQQKMKLYWHLDETYLGFTENIHQVELIPAIGQHILTVVDENGKTAAVRFEVTGKN